MHDDIDRDWIKIDIQCIAQEPDRTPNFNAANVSASQSGSNVNGPGKGKAKANYEDVFDITQTDEDAFMEDTPTESRIDATPALSVVSSSSTSPDVDGAILDDEIDIRAVIPTPTNSTSSSSLSTLALQSLQSSLSTEPRGRTRHRDTAVKKYVSAGSRADGSFHLPSAFDDVVFSFSENEPMDTQPGDEARYGLDSSVVLLHTDHWTQLSMEGEEIYADEIEMMDI